MPFQKFINRYQAARLLLAEPEICRYRNASDTLILAIPRGALQMGEVFHDKLGLPLDIIGTKKIPHPFNEELAIGAVGPYGIFFVDTVSFPDIPSEYVEKERRRLENAIAKSQDYDQASHSQMFVFLREYQARHNPSAVPASIFYKKKICNCPQSRLPAGTRECRPR